MAHQQLADVVYNLAESDPQLSEPAKLAILGALDSEESLADALASQVNTTRPPPTAKSIDKAEHEPIGAFLTSIEVAGFRGIGPSSTLTLQPGPGLTVVAGRNGSGKSSFAEGLELALTGDSYRWSGEKSALWAGAWRNIHHGTPCEVRIGLAEEGSGSTTVGLDWNPGAELADRKTWVQRAGGQREEGLASLGWGAALDLYRPLLSYDELSGLLEGKPCQLFDALEKLLGLEQIKDAQVRLAIALKRLRQPENEAKAAKIPLKAALEGSVDERAVTALSQVRKQRPNLDTVLRLATGTTAQPSGELTKLRALTTISVPPGEVVKQAANELRSAVGTVAGYGERTVALVESRTELLARAVKLHSEHGDTACPICGEGRLDDTWHARVAEELAKENTDLANLRTARDLLGRRRGSARELLGMTIDLTAPDGVDLTSMARARTAREAWLAAPSDDLSLANHLLDAHTELAAAVSEVRAEAATQLVEREDAWTPIAQQLASWAEVKQQAESQSEDTRTVQAAVNWLKENVTTLRNQRLEPLAAGARAIWAELRQEGNVGLGAITLEGQSNRRHVELVADVDGTETRALSVMSRGELHALALALFLPRATMQASPLRFVVLDDPVQAMDPAKVDGFAHVLMGIARDRQVVVFSHDDRLADVVRRIDPAARIVEVTRSGNSEVQIADSRTPARRYVEDARALASDKHLNDDVRDKVLPGLCRFALEAAALEVFHRKQYGTGKDRLSTENAWNNAVRTKQKVALALHGNTETDVSPWRDAQSWRKTTMSICTRGAHQGLGTAPHWAVDQLEKTVADMLGGRS